MRGLSIVAIAVVSAGIGMGVQAIAQAPRQLPPQCLKVAKFDPSMGGMHPPGASDMGAGVGTQDEAHKALSGGMASMHMNMEIGMSAVDIDVAFTCGMIPHHQGAVDMAQAVIRYGKDPWVKGLAQGIVTAQEKEIEEMTAWVADKLK